MIVEAAAPQRLRANSQDLVESRINEIVDDLFAEPLEEEFFLEAQVPSEPDIVTASSDEAEESLDEAIERTFDEWTKDAVEEEKDEGKEEEESPKDTSDDTRQEEEDFLQLEPKETKGNDGDDKNSSQSNDKKIKGKHNELTHLLPGYTAPMRGIATFAKPAPRKTKLAPPSLDSTRNFKTGFKYRAPLVNQADKRWFHMRGTDPASVKMDLQLIKHRNYMDPKRFYKKADNLDNVPFVQRGTVIEGPTEYFSGRLTKKERKQTLVDELIATQSDYAKRKYAQMQRDKQSKRPQKFKRKRR